MITVKDLLDIKGTAVWHIKPDVSIFEALKLMAEKDVGALPVLMDGKIVGIFSERDYVRKLVKNENITKDSLIADFMTKGVISVKPTSELFVCMILMTDMKIRHLPVVENECLIGIITIGDVVNTIIHSQKKVIADLENYILGSNYGPK